MSVQQQMTEFVETLRNRLGLDDSYSSDISRSVQRIVKRWLRDYNFQKALRVETYEDLAEGASSVTLPDATKRPVQVYFSDTSDADAPAYSDPLLRRDGFVGREADGVPRYFWQVGLTLYINEPIPADSPNTNLVVYYLSLDVVDNFSWLITEFEDMLFNFCMLRLSAEYGKPELAQIYAALWGEDMKSLAIYTNELNFSDLEMLMHQARPQTRERYPVS